jgi:DNA-binding CsgD family transcriptional regulator
MHRIPVRGRPPAVTGAILEILRSDLARVPAQFGYESSRWSGSLLAHHLQRKCGLSLSPRHCRRLLARLGVTPPVEISAQPDRDTVPWTRKRNAIAPHAMAGVISDSHTKEVALRRIRRLCSSGLPLAPLVSGIFDLVQAAIPNSDNKVLLADPGNNASRYLMNNPELAKWTPIHKRYYIDAPPAISGMRVRFAEPYLSKFFARTTWTSEDFALPHFRRSEGYNEFLRPLGFDHMLWATFADHGERVGSYPIWRSVDMRPFSRDDLRFITLAAPHIAHGLKVAYLFADPQQTSADDFVPGAQNQIAVVILDQRGKVIGADKEAEAVFAELGIAGGLHPETLRPPGGRELFAYIARMVDGIFRDATSDSGLSVPAVRICSYSTGTVIKMRGVMVRRSDGRCYVSVLIEQGELRAHRRTRLAATLGLSRTDMAILDGLRNGLTSAEIAGTMQVARDTLKTYVGRLADKLGRQAGLAQVRSFAHESWV